MEATREITFLYSLREAVCVEDQIAFDKPLNVMLRQPLGVMNNWLNNWRDLLPASVSQAETTSKHGNTAIYTYMKDPDQPVNNMTEDQNGNFIRRTNAVKKR